MSNSTSRSRTQRHSASRWCQLMVWTAGLLFTLPLMAGIQSSEIITYQGRLLDNGTPYTGTVDMDFRLWNAESGGNLAATDSVSNVAVSGGLFQVELQFGSQPYEDGLWLEVEADNITLTPRQRVGAVPLALHALDGGGGYWELSGGALSFDGEVSIGSDPNTQSLFVTGRLLVEAGSGMAVRGESSGVGVRGVATGLDGRGLLGISEGDNGYGVLGVGFPNASAGVRGEGPVGVEAEGGHTGIVANGDLMGVIGTGDSIGVFGSSAGDAVQGWASDANGYGGRFGGVEGSSSYFTHPVGILASDPAATLEINGPGVGGNNLALRVSVSDDEKFVVGGLGTSIYQPVFIDGTVAITSFLTGASTDVCHTGSPGSTGVLAECSSSARYKSDISSLKSTMALVEQLRPVSYRWTESGEEDVGLVAEEVAEVEPRLVTYNRNGQVEGVKYRQLNALLIGALQEQSRDMDRMHEEIQALTQQLEQTADLTRRNLELSNRVDRLEELLLEWQAVARTD
jgi:hypothetical protein